MVKQWTKISITSVYVCVYICIYMYIYILLITYKSIHGLAPEYLTELIKLKTSGRYHLRSCDKLLLDCPRIKTRVTLGDRSFAIAAPTLWNSLPMEVRYATSVTTFKKLLKTYLFSKAYICNNIIIFSPIFNITVLVYLILTTIS